MEGDDVISEVSADIEFYHLMNTLLKSGEILDIADVQDAYHNILNVNGLNTAISRRSVKRNLVENVADVEFCRSPRANEPDRIYSSKTKKNAIDDLEEATRDTNKDMKAVFDCAAIIRNDIAMSHKQQPWKFEGSLSGTDHIPKSLETFIRWILIGPMSSLKSTQREQSVQLLTRTIAQNIMFAHKSDRQVAYVPKQIFSGFRHQNENPQVVGVGLSVHQATRSKTEVGMLHKFGYSVSYERILRIETQLANAVIRQMAQHNGVYILDALVRGRFTFFAIDNVDFSEDTPDGTGTLHATATAVFQFQNTSKPTQNRILGIHGAASDKSLSSLSPTAPRLLPCNISSQQKLTLSSKHPEFAVQQNEAILHSYKAEELSWLLIRYYQRHLQAPSSESSISEADDIEHDEVMDVTDVIDGEPSEDTTERDTASIDMTDTNLQVGVETNRQTVPSWSAFNSMRSSSNSSITSVHALPLLAAPAHEYATLLTALKQAEYINRVVVGPNKKAVMTLDMALYERAKKLEMLQPDCKEKWILRIGEFHTVLCALRAIGATVEGSGIDDTWIAAEIYGPLTTQQILEGKHMRRSLDAHIMTLQVFFDLYIEAFLKDQTDLQQSIKKPLQDLADACRKGDSCDVAEMHRTLLDSMEQEEVQRRLDQFDEQHKDNPMFIMASRYMDMVITLLEFIRATRARIWRLHLSSLESLCKYFFAHNRLKYAQMVPLYIADMYALKDNDPDIWEEFCQGHFCVKKSQVPFFAV